MKSPEKKNKILIPIDDSIDCHVASNYVRHILGSQDRGLELVLLHVVPKAKSKEEENLREIPAEEKLEKMKELLNEIKNGFIEAGFNPESIRIEIDKGKHETAAESILDYLEKEHFGTVVIGRRGISKAEEFLYGSVSQKVVREAKGCTVWVVEPAE
ncbi:MAG: universal stress protein [bacterium]|nr:universal stress protein [bacterium]